MNHIREWIPESQCKRGWMYKISARNSDMGIYLPDRNGFVILREKFRNVYLFVELHWDQGAPFGTAKPLSEVEEVPSNVISAILNDLYETPDTVDQYFGKFYPDLIALKRRNKSISPEGSLCDVEPHGWYNYKGDVVLVSKGIDSMYPDDNRLFYFIQDAVGERVFLSEETVEELEVV